MSDNNGAMPTITIGRTSLGAYLGGLWRYRNLALHLSNADLQSRFRRSSLGVVWAMIHPMAFAILYSTMLSLLFKQDMRELSVYVFSGVVVWEAISTYINAGSVTFLTAAGYLKQAAIPMLLFPIRTCLTATSVTILGVISFALYASAMTVFFGFEPIFSVYWGWIVPLLASLFFIGVPWATIIGFINAKYRDTQQILIIVLQAVWFASPVFFQRELFDAPALKVWSIVNPVVAFCDAFRDPVLHGRAPSQETWLVIGVWTLLSWAVAGVMLIADRRRTIYYL